MDQPRPVPFAVVLPLAMLLPLLASSCGDGTAASDSQTEIYRVERGDLRIAVREMGNTRALRETRVRTQVEGQATIIFLIPEGSQVEAGQKLVELDASELQEREANQAISVSRAKASLVAAQQNLEILEKELSALDSSARSKLEIARLALEKYLGRVPQTEDPSVAQRVGGDVVEGGGTLASGGTGSGRTGFAGTNREMFDRLGTLVLETEYTGLPAAIAELLGEANLDRDMGEMAQQVLNQIDQIRLAGADLKLKEDTLNHSKRLAAKDYITRNELDKHQLDFDSQKSRVSLAWNELDLLVHYGLRSEKIDLELTVDNAVIELEKTIASNNARREREREELNASQQEYDLAKDRLDNLRTQIANAQILAPTPGLVVYAEVGDGRRGGEVIEEGMSVRERQTLIILPDTTTMIAELKVAEADVDKVVRGQQATVFVDAFPGEGFPARVTRISPLPDSGSRWSNNNKKVYKTEVTLEGSNEVLRPGMSSTVEILIGIVPDVLQVPMPAIHRQGSVHYVWKIGPDGKPIDQRVEVGRNNLSHVEIVAGLAVGDQVYLATPQGAAAPTYEQPAAAEDADPTELAPGGAPSAGAVSATDPSGTAPPSEPESESADRAPRGPGDAPAEGENGEQRRPRRAPSPEMTAFLELVKQKLPAFATELEGATGMRALFTNQELTAAIEADPDLSAARDKAMAGFRNRGAGGGPGAGRGEGRPERTEAGGDGR